MCVLTVYIYALDDVLHFPSNSTKEKRQRDGIVFFCTCIFVLYAVQCFMVIDSAPFFCANANFL